MEIGGVLYLYHEKQDAGLCAVHCLNALLQGPYFSEVDLATIAKDFDERERLVMLESGADSKDFLKFMAEDSGNLADDGNYSIQVVAKALEVWNLQVLNILVPEARMVKEKPTEEQAFICNLASHWLTIRKVGQDWYNLNSLLAGPQYLSPFYLSAFLDSLILQGYSVFCVRGPLPPVIPDPSVLNDPTWKKAPRPSSSTSSAQNSISKYEEDLEAALEASELEAALAASLAPPSPAPTQHETASQVSEEEEMDEELQAALQLSQQLADSAPGQVEEEPEKGPNTTELVFRLPDGSRLQRRFSHKSTIESVMNFLSTKGFSKQNHMLMTTHPARRYDDLLLTLEDAGLVPSAALIVQKKDV